MEQVLPATCHLGLGSNLGNRLGYLRLAVDTLGEHAQVEVVRRSSLYETAPVGGPPNQGPYLNAVVAVRTSLTPGKLLGVCQQIEQQAGRVRAEPDGPRTLDFDLLLWGSVVSDEPACTIPHPRMHLRRFVLEPLVEIAGRVVHPVLGRPLRALLAALHQSEAGGQVCARVAGPGWDPEGTSSE